MAKSKEVKVTRVDVRIEGRDTQGGTVFTKTFENTKLPIRDGLQLPIPLYPFRVVDITILEAKGR